MKVVLETKQHIHYIILIENKQYKANTNMNKKLIRLTESDLIVEMTFM